MKLLVDAHIFDDSYQGIRTYIQGLYSQLIKLAPDIDFYFACYDTAYLKTIFGESKNVHYVKFRSKNKIYRLAFDFPHIIKENKIDIAHFQYISPLVKRCKEIVTIHDVLFMDFPEFFPVQYRIKNKYLFKRSALRADLLLTVSNYSRNAISKHFGIPSSAIFITPNGVQFGTQENKKAHSNMDILSKYNLKKYILYVGRIEPRKNHVFLIKAFEELRLWEKGYDLVFIGKKEKFDNSVDAYIKKLPCQITSHIRIYDQIDNDELRSFYSNASLFVFPSLAEGFGIPPIEAILSNTPCLCANVTAMQDFDFLGNRFFDPYNIEELKAKISAELNNKVDTVYNTEIQEVLNRYNWKNIASDFHQLIQNIFE